VTCVDSVVFLMVIEHALSQKSSSLGVGRGGWGVENVAEELD
jgi:hypothetical protein